MTPRLSMFTVGMLAVGMMAGVLSAQCVGNPDGTITCPILAPALPAAAVATASEDDPLSGAGSRLTLRERRAMGFTRLNVIRTTTRLARAGELPSTRGLSGADLEAARAEIKDAVAAEIMGENIQVWKSTVQDDRDWSQFFEALIAFLERLMPLILQLIDLFGGLADATVVPIVDLAAAVPIELATAA